MKSYRCESEICLVEDMLLESAKSTSDSGPEKKSYIHFDLKQCDVKEINTTKIPKMEMVMETVITFCRVSLVCTIFMKVAMITLLYNQRACTVANVVYKSETHRQV